MELAPLIYSFKSRLETTIDFYRINKPNINKLLHNIIEYRLIQEYVAFDKADTENEIDKAFSNIKSTLRRLKIIIENDIPINSESKEEDLFLLFRINEVLTIMNILYNWNIKDEE